MKKLTPVSDLLAQGKGMLQRLREGTQEADRALAGLRRQLPPELAREVWGAILKDGKLVVLVRSAAWGTRLRYLAPRFKDDTGGRTRRRHRSRGGEGALGPRLIRRSRAQCRRRRWAPCHLRGR